MNIADISTKDLSDELERREGVSKVVVKPYESITIKSFGHEIDMTGPAVILINID
jgi:hypothetical protein